MILARKISQKMIWILATIFFSYQFIIRLSPGALYEDFILRYNIDATNFALLSGTYYIGYAFMQLPIGIFLYKYGIKKVLLFASLCCAFANLLLLIPDIWQIALISRFMVGCSSAAGALAAINSAKICFREKNVTKMIGWGITISLLGAIAGKSINFYLSSNFEWEVVVILLSFPGLILALLVHFLTRNPSKKHHNQNRESAWVAIKNVATNSQLILIGISGALLVGPLETFADVWGSQFFIKVYHFSKEDAGILSGSCIYFGMCIGAPALSYIVEKYKNHYSINALCGFIMAIMFALFILQITSNYYILFIMNFVIGFMCAYQTILFAATSQITPASKNGIAIAFINMLNMGAGFSINHIFGVLVDYSASKNINFTEYQSSDFVNATYILPITLIIGSLGFILARTSKYQRVQKYYQHLKVRADNTSSNQ